MVSMSKVQIAAVTMAPTKSTTDPSVRHAISNGTAKASYVSAAMVRRSRAVRKQPSGWKTNRDDSSTRSKSIVPPLSQTVLPLANMAPLPMARLPLNNGGLLWTDAVDSSGKLIRPSPEARWRRSTGRLPMLCLDLPLPRTCSEFLELHPKSAVSPPGPAPKLACFMSIDIASKSCSRCSNRASRRCSKALKDATVAGYVRPPSVTDRRTPRESPPDTETSLLPSMRRLPRAHRQLDTHRLGSVPVRR
mmetsp:Transcript_9513/g.27534  ORF Transcript_9513/g.27534 Transcript_9513/m.27534 type:complete len:248 (+) Transcript_9513:2542-3285(+)